MTSLAALNKTAGGSSTEASILLKNLDVEFEVRRSNLVDLYSQDYLESCLCEINFDEENVTDLQNSGEIEAAATLQMEVVSKNKKAFRTRIKEKELFEYVPKTIPQRLFLPDDVIQIQITNQMTHSHCVQLKPIDLPLCLSGAYTHWAQIGTTS